ncbi:MAG: GNAT family N-acetyltransferase [Candidatus Eisenbacteria bacterium]|nr:GNAT family N-acetyltransferase [Candidatus Eisenbacteria bacterium]
MIREAGPDDIDDLIELERGAFKGDRISRRSFRHLLAGARGRVFVAVEDGVIVAYAVVLFRASSATARLYSVAVLPRQRRSGIGRGLVERAERAAVEAGCARMRLEIREDNDASSRFFERLGYRAFGRWDEYYDDRMSALRYEKHLAESKEAPGSA